MNVPALEFRLLDDLLRAGRAGGAQVVEVGCDRVRSLRLEGLRGAGPIRETATWTVRAWGDDGRCGVASGDDPHAVVASALSRRGHASPMLTPVDVPALRGASGIEDPRLGQIGEAERLEVIANVERALGPHRRHALAYEESRVLRLWGNSRGVLLQERGSLFSLDVAVDGPLGITREGVAARRFADVASRPLGLAVRRRADVALRAADLPDDVSVLMEPRIFAGVLDALAGGFATRPLPAWLAASVDGARALSRALTVMDNGALRNGLRTRGFDARGVAPRPVPLLVAGVVGHGYRSVEDGAPTGHTGHDGALSPCNVVAHPGIRTRNMLLAEMPRGVVVDALPPYDPVQMGFVGDVRLCCLRGGERAGMVRMPIRVGLGELVGELLEVGSDEERHGHVDAVSGLFAPGLLARFARFARGA